MYTLVSPFCRTNNKKEGSTSHGGAQHRSARNCRRIEALQRLDMCLFNEGLRKRIHAGKLYIYMLLEIV